MPKTDDVNNFLRSSNSFLNLWTFSVCYSLHIPFIRLLSLILLSEIGHTSEQQATEKSPSDWEV